MIYENDEFFDEYWATVCYKCHENTIEPETPICGSCSLNELAELYV